LKRSTYELFYIPVGVNEARFEPGDYESFHIELEPGFLEDIAETYPNVMELLSRFYTSSKKGTPMIPVSMGYVSRAVIKKIRSCDKNGGDLLIELYRYIVDLFSEYISGIREEERDKRRENFHHKEILLEIKKEIISDPNIENQELSKLSKKYRIGLTELKKEFRLFFGETPAAFVRSHALAKAHYLITTTDETIERIAYEVGYGFRSNFDKSFKKQFGYSPASLR
jgi:AraC-like DNA-binding protein